MSVSHMEYKQEWTALFPKRGTPFVAKLIWREGLPWGRPLQSCGREFGLSMVINAGHEDRTLADNVVA